MNHPDADRKAQFEELGYTVFESLYSRTVIERWQEFVRGLEAGKGNLWIYGNLLERIPSLAFMAISNATILDFAERVMGPFVQLDGLTLVGTPPVKKSGAGSRELHWHRDPWGSVPRCAAFERPLAVNAICYLQDLNEEVGPLRVIPQSHRQPITIPPQQRTIPYPSEQCLYLKAGDTIFLHNNLIHSRTPNTSDGMRYYFSVYYSLSWLRPTAKLDGHNARQYLRSARLMNDRRIMRLLGEDPQLEARGNSGFLSPDEACWQDWISEDVMCLRQPSDVDGDEVDDKP